MNDFAIKKKVFYRTIRQGIRVNIIDICSEASCSSEILFIMRDFDSIDEKCVFIDLELALLFGSGEIDRVNVLLIFMIPQFDRVVIRGSCKHNSVHTHKILLQGVICESSKRVSISRAKSSSSFFQLRNL